MWKFKAVIVICLMCLGLFLVPSLAQQIDQSTSVIDQDVPQLPADQWATLGGVAQGSCAVIDGQGRKHVFVKGANNDLWDNVDGTWVSYGGMLSTVPFAIRSSTNLIHVFAGGFDNALWDKIIDTSAQTSLPWKSLGGIISSMPTAVLDPTGNHIKIAVKGTPNGLWICDLDTTTLASTWNGYGGIFNRVPYIVYDRYATPYWHVFVNAANVLWVCNGPSGTWLPLGGSITSSPVAVVEPRYTNVFAILVRGSDGALWLGEHMAQNPLPYSINWYNLGGAISTDTPAVVTVIGPPPGGVPSYIHTFVKGTDNALWESVFNCVPWNPSGAKWYSHGGGLIGYISALIGGTTTNAYVIGTDNALWRDTFTTNIA